jgi:hypothetical protein
MTSRGFVAIMVSLSAEEFKLMNHFVVKTIPAFFVAADRSAVFLYE